MSMIFSNDEITLEFLRWFSTICLESFLADKIAEEFMALWFKIFTLYLNLYD